LDGRGGSTRNRSGTVKKTKKVQVLIKARLPTLIRNNVGGWGVWVGVNTASGVNGHRRNLSVQKGRSGKNVKGSGKNSLKTEAAGNGAFPQQKKKNNR